METVLEVSKLTKLYKNKRGIHDIDFDIQKGDIFGFLGPNGAGKTTTMKIITGLCRADTGSVKIFGKDVTKSFEQAMENVGCIIETPDAYEYMSAINNLKMISQFYDNIADNDIEEALEMVGLLKYKKEKVGSFSLGMKQRLGLASAILPKPGLVILDEPANGLDIEGTVDIRNTIKLLSEQRGTTFFISSHMVHEMELTCNKIAIINDGRLLCKGAVSELLQGFDSLEDFFIQNVRKQREIDLS